MFINFKRILKFSWHTFSRNKGLSFQVIFIMATAVFFVLFFFLGRGVGATLLDELGKKVDISVYFKREVSEQDIMKVKDHLSLLSDKVKSIDYISKERALTVFKAEHQNDELYLRAVEEAKDNPFLPSLNIYSDDPDYYVKISEFFNGQSVRDMVEKISYEQPKHKLAIERLSNITKSIKVAGISLIVLMGLLVVVITSNIIKLSFIILKDEIATMKLVGASNWFVRGPFMISTFFYGLFAVVAIDIVAGVAFYFLSARAGHWLSDFSPFNYLFDNFLIIFCFQLGFVALLGFVATLLAMRRHLKT